MICQNCRSNIATRRYHYGLGAMRRLTVLDDECAEKLRQIGMDLRVEGAIPHQPKPRWFGHPRDFTGSVA